MHTVLYARVSTADQNISIQKEQAEKAGFVIDEVIADENVSGISTKLADRPEGRRLFDKLRRGDVLVVRWLDRLGRNYQDVTDTIRQFMREGVVVRTVINNMVFDGAETDPMKQAVRDALIAFMAATGQAQAEATKEAQKAGIEAAKRNPQNYKGKKPSFDRQTYESVIDLIGSGKGATAISRETGICRQSILRIKASPEIAEQALMRWGM